MKGDRAARRRVAHEPAVAVQEGARGGWLAEREWPPRGTEPHVLPLLAGAYTDSAGNKAEQGDDPGGACREDNHARCNPASRTGQGTWTFSQPLPAALRLAGVAHLRATVEAPAGARMIAIVYDVDRDGRATLLTRGASLVGSGTVAFDLYPQDWRLAEGHRVGVLLAGSDDLYFEPGTTGESVRVVGGSLSLPVLSPARATSLPGGPSRAVSERTSFQVDPGVLSTRASKLTSPARPRLHLRVTPRRVRARRLVTLRIRTTNARGDRVRGARVRVGRRLVRTGRRGQIRVRVRFNRTGRRVLRASKPGYRKARAWVRVVA